VYYEGSGNDVIGRMHTDLNNRIAILRRLSLSQPGRLSETVLELERVVSSIESGNARLARKYAREHAESGLLSF
jgi:DNA-binding GntR family transcriptional regulator